ncbi:hypothetical protein BGX34_007071, partial [Mortierella sp. NVP85]
PYTVFNLASFDQAHSGGVAVSNLFHKIACNVIRHGTNATLKKKTVKQVRRECADESIVSSQLDGILTLYRGESSVPILGNTDLNKFLERLASHMSSYINTGNKAVASFVTNEFTTPTA